MLKALGEQASEQRITIEVLAELASLSVGYFVRAFKQSAGVTPHDDLMRRRVQLAIQLLAGTDMSMSEIAHAAGFADQSHFARRFRHKVGMSPRDYRWLIQQAPGVERTVRFNCVQDVKVGVS
jgi:AraC-like DNA-binding protein